MRTRTPVSALNAVDQATPAQLSQFVGDRLAGIYTSMTGFLQQQFLADDGLQVFQQGIPPLFLAAHPIGQTLDKSVQLRPCNFAGTNPGDDGLFFSAPQLPGDQQRSKPAGKRSHKATNSLSTGDSPVDSAPQSFAKIDKHYRVIITHYTKICQAFYTKLYK